MSQDKIIVNDYFENCPMHTGNKDSIMKCIYHDVQRVVLDSPIISIYSFKFVSFSIAILLADCWPSATKASSTSSGSVVAILLR